MSRKAAGRCIFCGGPGLSKQHVMPRWLGDVVQCDAPDHTQLLTRVDMSLPGHAVIQPLLRSEQGDFFSRKIRKVCRTCNSGWMSRLEGQAKPHLTAMIMNRQYSLGPPAQESVAAWIAMTSIMAEFTDLPTAAIPEQDRTYLRKHLKPPQAWRMWLGSYEGERWIRRYRHYGGAAVHRDQFVVLPATMNFQHTIVVVGSLFVHAISSAMPDLMVEYKGHTGELLTQLWPPCQAAINWPRPQPLTDDDADFVANVPLRQSFETAKQARSADA